LRELIKFLNSEIRKENKKESPNLRRTRIFKKIKKQIEGEAQWKGK
jgi:hypothetical protein